MSICLQSIIAIFEAFKGSITHKAIAKRLAMLLD